MDAPNPTPLERLSALIHLEDRARGADNTAQLGFIIVNETIGLAPYRQAILWSLSQGVTALSGVPTVNPHIPMVQWANKVCRQIHRTLPDVQRVEPHHLAADEQAQWPEWLPPFGLWLPLPHKRESATAALLLARDTPWNDGELFLLRQLAGAYGHAWSALFMPTPWQRWRRSLSKLSPLRLLLAAALTAALLALPVQLSVLAPGEMVAANPALVRAPLEGVIEKIHVRPNNVVAQGDLLVELDPTTLKSKLEVAAKTLTTAEAEYRQTTQQAVWDPKSKAQLAILSGRIEERQAEVDYLTELLDRIQVKAPRDGVAVFDDPSSWLGRPVAMGEKIMIVTGLHDTEVEAWLAIGDDIELPPATTVTFFPNVDPLNPVAAQLRYVAYEAIPRPNGTLAFRLRATVTGPDKPRVGLKGTARIDGEPVSLAYWLMRKPLAFLRQAIGL